MPRKKHWSERKFREKRAPANQVPDPLMEMFREKGTYVKPAEKEKKQFEKVQTLRAEAVGSKTRARYLWVNLIKRLRGKLNLWSKHCGARSRLYRSRFCK